MEKIEALKIILDCAKKYNTNLNNKSLLFIACNKERGVYSFEARFTSSNFVHLTGIKHVQEITGEKISPSDFLERCINNKLSIKHFDLAEDGTTQLKLEVLPKLMNPNLPAKMLGKFDDNKTKLYTENIAGSTYGCMGFVKDKKDYYNYPNTVLNDDIRKNVVCADRILITYRKNITDEYYSEIVYKTKKYDFSKLIIPKYPYLKYS